MHSEGTVLPTILLVDDNEAVARVVTLYLQREYNLVWKENPIEAIQWLEEGNRADLIISDIRMPEMRGDEFLAWIKQHPLHRDIPTIMLSCEDSTTEKSRLLKEGAADYIVKPFNPIEINSRIKNCIC